MDSVKSLSCPNCGGSLNVNKGERTFFCHYCGSQLQYDDGILRMEITQTLHKYDDNRIKELEYQIREDERKRLEETNRKNNWKTIFIAVGLICLLLFAIGIVFINIITRLSVISFALSILTFATSICVYFTSVIQRENRTDKVSESESTLFGMHIKSEESITPYDKIKTIWKVYAIFAGSVVVLVIIILIVLAFV